MKMKNWIMGTLMTIALTVAVFGVTGCKSACCKADSKSENMSGNKTEHAMQYYCPMHPEVVQSTPGKCPKCGMDLVEKP